MKKWLLMKSINQFMKCDLYPSYSWGQTAPVKITNAKSGLMRRLIDIYPSGTKIPLARYNRLITQVKFELGSIAYHCLQVYEEDKHAYDDYKPILMISESNDFYNFVSDSYMIFKKR